jgi:hypothetical protein
MQKDIYVVTVTRGSKTRYSYGEKLKEALAVANPRKGESFRYARFSRSKVNESRWLGNGVYETATG